MSSKEKVDGSSLHRWVLTTIILCAIVWWASADALAQDAVSIELSTTARSTSWSLERPASNKVPYLVIGMADRRDALPYGSFGYVGDEATNRSVGNTITRQVGPAASANRTERIESDPLILASLLDPTAGIRGLTNFRAGPANPHQTIQRSPQRSPDLAGAKGYSLLDDRSAPGTFLYGYQANYLTSKQWLADDESFAHEIGQAPRPLMQLELGAWRLPVVLLLYRAAVSR
jgi:hypothetical protein